MKIHESDEDLIARVLSAAEQIQKGMPSSRIPLDGFRIGYARKTPRRNEDVAAMPFPHQGGSEKPMVSPFFGADPGLSRDIITVTRFDPDIRAVGIIRDIQGLSNVCQELLFEVCPYGTGRMVPPATEAMEWGIAACCKEGVPDVIIEKGNAGNDGKVWFFSEVPEACATNILMCLARIHTTPL